MNEKDTAIRLFVEGANCAQAVLAAFAPVCGIDQKTALKISAPFGGGIGRQREVCGAISGMCMAAGLLYGYTDLSDTAAKAAHYAMIQELCAAFRDRFGSIICRELLGSKKAFTSPIPDERNEEYYRTRPCARQVGAAAEILAEYIEKHPVGREV